MYYECIQWLLHFKGIGRKKARMILEVDQDLDALMYGGLSDLIPYEDLLDLKARAILQSRQWDRYKEDRIRHEDKGIQMVTILDATYPKELLLLNDAPLVLYCKGNLDLLQHSHKIGVVGTRIPSDYGRQQTDALTRGLVESGCCIVSGLAMGIDACAHKTALKYEGDTIGVLGCGIDQVYPKSNTALYRGLESRGLLISEYKCGVDPRPNHFPERNRIIAGLSQAVLVMEASKKSGSLITAEMAMDQGTAVFALPGPIHSSKSEGCNALIYSGAIPIVNQQTLLADLSLDYYHRKTLPASEVGEKILVAIETRGPLDLDTLVEATGEDYSKVLLGLYELETQGLVTYENAFYSKIK